MARRPHTDDHGDATALDASDQAERVQIFLTVHEVAGILIYDPETVRKKFRNGSLPGKKVGGKWLALKHEIEQLAGVRLLLDPTAGWVVDPSHA